jgi:hypothetical protein
MPMVPWVVSGVIILMGILGVLKFRNRNNIK